MKFGWRLAGDSPAERRGAAGSCSFSCSCSISAVVCAERLRSRFARRPPKAAPRPPHFFLAIPFFGAIVPPAVWQNPAAGCGNPIHNGGYTASCRAVFLLPCTFKGLLYPKHLCFHCTVYGAVMREALLTPAGFHCDRFSTPHNCPFFIF